VKRQFAVLAVLFFAITAPAHAGLTVTTSTLQAGDPADVTIHATFASTPSSIHLHLPPGLVGDPSGPKCSQAAFQGLGCFTGQVGTASVSGLPLGAVYNLEPNADEPARLGISIAGLVKNQATISLRPDGGLDSTIADLQTGGIPLTDLSLTLNSSFMTLPTSCRPATVTLNSDSASFTPTGCEKVPFNPRIEAALETTKRAVPSGATVTLKLPEGDSHVRRTDIVLPLGTTLNPGVADGLTACTPVQYDATACPGASQVGTVSFDTPLLGVLGGKVFFGENFALYVVVQGHGVLVKLAGVTKLDPNTGQITTTFDDLPQVPFTTFALSFNGGPHAVLANPQTCGAKLLDALLTPWSGTAPKTATAMFTIDQGCTFGFSPGLTVSALSTAAGRPAGATTMTVSRTDNDQNLRSVTANLPPGLAGSLKGVPVCPDANADAGTCPADSRVGAVNVTAGSGDAPVALAGTVYLTGPTDGGLAGLAITLPGKVGPVDLGTVVTRAGILLRPDGGLTVKTRPLPAVVGGVPISIRSLALTLDRAGFILNSSSCAPQQVTALLEAADGSTSTVSAPYQATDCGALKFAPKLEATLGAKGKTKSGSFPPLKAVITVPAGQSSTASAEVALPKTLSVELARLNKACQPGQSPCPAAAKIGTATATTPLLPGSLTSAVTLAIPKPGELPGLSLNLTGAVTLPLFGKVDVFQPDHRVRNQFAGIPDVPLERFELDFTTNSPLRLQGDACHGARQKVTGTFVGHSGAKASLSAPLKIAGCPPVATLKHNRIKVKPGRDGAKIKRVKKVKRGNRYRLTVTDRAGHTWKLSVRVRR
jgi:hypothetical protein